MRFATGVPTRYWEGAPAPRQKPCHPLFEGKNGWRLGPGTVPNSEETPQQKPDRVRACGNRYFFKLTPMVRHKTAPTGVWVNDAVNAILTFRNGVI